MNVPRPVLFVHHGGDWIRGSERCLLDHVVALDRSRYAPVLWTNCRPLADAIAAQHVPVMVDRFTVVLDSRRPHYDVRNYSRLIRRGIDLIRRHDVALVHCNASEACQWVVPAAHRTGVPVVAQLHLEIGLRSRCVRLIHQASVITGVSRAAVDRYVEDGVSPQTVTIIPPTVDAARLAMQPPVTRAALGIDERAFVFLGVGSLIDHKGFDLLIRSFATIAPRADRRPLLLIAGEGPARHSLEGLVRTLDVGDRVRLLGEYPHAPALMRDVADAFVLTSRREAYGLVLVEAGFYGVPCIGTRVGGVAEILADERTGLLVPADDELALRSAMQRFIHAPEAARRLGAALRDQVMSRMLAPASTRRLEHLYDECLRAHGNGGARRRWRWYPVYSRWSRHAAASLGRRVLMK